MLASITPLGERSRRQRWTVTVGFLAAGAVAAAAASGAFLAGVGELVHPGARASLVALAAVLAIGLLLDLGTRLPTHLRQVDERWLHLYRGWVYGLGFGLQLGVGAATVVTTSTVYVTLAAELLAPSVAWGTAIGVAFGAARGLTPLLTARVDSPARLAALHRRVHALERPMTQVTLGAQTALIAVALAVAV
jgi:hypothetical protein